MFSFYILYVYSWFQKKKKVNKESIWISCPNSLRASTELGFIQLSSKWCKHVFLFMKKKEKEKKEIEIEMGYIH